MGVLFTPKHLIRQRHKYVRIYSQIMRHHTGNVYMNLTDQETYDQYPDTSTPISFHIYHLIARFTTHGRLLLTDKNFLHKCKHDYVSEKSTKKYTRKELVMMETIISKFHTSFYIPEIQKLAFHIPHVQILGTNHCGNSRQTEFKLNESVLRG